MKLYSSTAKPLGSYYSAAVNGYSRILNEYVNDENIPTKNGQIIKLFKEFNQYTSTIIEKTRNLNQKLNNILLSGNEYINNKFIYYTSPLEIIKSVKELSEVLIYFIKEKKDKYKDYTEIYSTFNDTLKILKIFSEELSICIPLLEKFNNLKDLEEELKKCYTENYEYYLDSDNVGGTAELS